ncbi:MAG TPA: PTS sugar transporter subunit IIA [Spirochaetia bacterium]|nr:PTS sugar transporter subunit IIA [Spirochaetia bacterium]
MKLSQVVDERAVIVGAEIASKEAAIDLVLDALYAHHRFVASKESIRALISKREKLGGTTFHSGVAIPHIRPDGFSELLVGVCVPKVPLVVESIEVRIVILVVAPKDSPSSYVNVLSTLVKVSQENELFNRLCASATAAEFVRILDESNVEVKKELTVRDVMQSKFTTVGPHVTLRDLTNLFYSESISYAPVVDEDGSFIGEVDIIDLIRVGIPDYAHMMGNLRFLHSFEPFEELLKNEDKIEVEEVMREPTSMLDPDDTVVEAALELDQRKRRRLPVVRDRKVLGILSDMDLLSKILRSR